VSLKETVNEDFRFRYS